MNRFYLAEVLPVIRRVRLPLVRDSWMLLMLAVNQVLIGVETYLAHSISGTIVGGEWVPILFGPVAGVLLFIAGLIALRRRMTANILATLVFLASIAVGIMGSYFHLRRAVLPDAPYGQQLTLGLLVWAPPLLGPITFALIGILGLSAAWQEEPVGSGRLTLPGGLHLQMPLSKSRAYFLLISLGVLITLISSVFDHVRTGFENPWLWIPVIVGVFATAVVFELGVIAQPTRADLLTYLVAMVLLMGTGMLGSGLHVRQDLIRMGVIVGERFIRGAPVMAPMLFANMGAFGLILLFDPGKEPTP